MKKILFLFISCLSFSFGQNLKLVDSLQRLLPSVPDTTKLHFLSDMSWELRTENKSKALDLAKQELELAQTLNIPKAIAQGHNDVGIIYFQKGNMAEALSSYMQSLAIREKLNDKNLIASSLNKIALIYHDMGKYSEALEMQLKILNIYNHSEREQYYIKITCQKKIK